MYLVGRNAIEGSLGTAVCEYTTMSGYLSLGFETLLGAWHGVRAW